MPPPGRSGSASYLSYLSADEIRVVNRVQDAATEFNKLKTKDYTGTGPLASLQGNIYYDPDKQNLSYPLDLGPNNKLYPHFIKFNVNQPAKSRYQSTFDNTAGGLSAVDINKSRFNQLAGAQLGAAATAGAAAAAGLIVGATEFATDLGRIAQRGDRNNSNPASALADDGFSATNAAKAAGLIGAGAATIAAAVISQVDLTRKTKRLLQTINLYMPDQIVMQTQNKYGEVSLTSALGAAGLGVNLGESVKGSIQDKIGNAPLSVSGAVDALKGAFGAAGPSAAEAQAGVLGAAGKKLGVFGEGIENILLQSYGYAQNPQIEILFDTTDMRMFQFTFNFLPRNKFESEEVMKIIRMFRFHAAPEIPETFSGRYYIPPSEFDISYMMILPDGTIVENPALHKFSTCVLENIDVNFVGASGQFVTFPDGRPVNIEMRLQFKEIEVIHKELIRNGY